jgi:hypothetical protein
MAAALEKENRSLKKELIELKRRMQEMQEERIALRNEIRVSLPRVSKEEEGR